MAEQRSAGHVQHGGATAAFPSPTAPHIRVGRPITRSTSTRSTAARGRLATWLRSHGARASFPVPGEAWHIEVPRDDLERLAKKVSDPLAGYPAKERRWIRTYDALVRMKHAGHDPADGSERRASAAPAHDRPPQGHLACRAAHRMAPAQAPRPLPVAARPNHNPVGGHRVQHLPGPPARHHRRPARRRARGRRARASPRSSTAFGVGDLSAAQQDALSGALTWSAILAGLLIGGDATLRAARNLADAKTDAAAMTAGQRLSPDDGLEDPATDFEEDEAAAVSDDEEFYADSELQALEARHARRQPRLRGE